MPALIGPSRHLHAAGGAGLALLLLALLLWPRAVQAQEENRAGLVILHGDGRVVRQCVAFAEESISGYELLQRAGGALSVEAGAMGATICSIDGEGCSYPAESCFCRCQGSPCVYWSYWRLQEDGGWRYQPLGAGNTRVQNGDVEAWRWAEGTRQSAPEPPPVTFAEICAPADVAAAAGPDTPAPVAEAAGGAAAGGTVAAGTTTAITSSQPPTLPNQALEPAQARQSGVESLSPSLWLLLGGALVLPAAALLAWALARRARVGR